MLASKKTVPVNQPSVIIKPNMEGYQKSLSRSKNYTNKEIGTSQGHIQISMNKENP